MVGSDRGRDTVDASRPTKNAYRRWYATLHPSLQLIGLQLWLPLFFIVMFCACYVAAFHAPTPHDVPVGVVATTAEAQQRIDTALGGSVKFIDYPTVDAAKQAVIHGAVAGAYDHTTQTIIIASAHQFQAASLVKSLLVPVLTRTEGAPTITDLVPLPPWDSFGMTSMYLMLAWCIGGYMTAMFIGLMGAPLRHRTRMAVIVGLGFVIALVTNILVGPVIGAIHGHFWPLVLMAWGWIVAIGLAVNGLSYFFGRFVALPAMVIFVFLSVPSSGAAYPPWLMPEPFAWLNNVVVGSGITEMLKRTLYGVGPGSSRGLVMMACYAAIGLLLMFVGKPYWQALRVRRVLRGKTTMFSDAQQANREFLARERDHILARHGLESTETGTISSIDLATVSAQDEARRSFEDERDSSSVLFGDDGSFAPPDRDDDPPHTDRREA
ncbi:ABC transporter permease [Leifsonia poae]|uniref:ABC transporter permease n=1 Tax=Leifsonia poae TaxID=110933 RepID=UPI001CBC11A7|nr:ABC transporter permease [Leifsonia poae]